jgi:hypothetical protein
MHASLRTGYALCVHPVIGFAEKWSEVRRDFRRSHSGCRQILPQALLMFGMTACSLAMVVWCAAKSAPHPAFGHLLPAARREGRRHGESRLTPSPRCAGRRNAVGSAIDCFCTDAAIHSVLLRCLMPSPRTAGRRWRVAPDEGRTTRQPHGSAVASPQRIEPAAVRPEGIIDCFEMVRSGALETQAVALPCWSRRFKRRGCRDLRRSHRGADVAVVGFCAFRCFCCGRRWIVGLLWDGRWFIATSVAPTGRSTGCRVCWRRCSDVCRGIRRARLLRRIG